MHSSRNISQILSPTLAAIALSTFIAGCTPASNDDGMSSSSSSRIEAMMEASSTTSVSSSAKSSADAMQTSSTTSTAAMSSKTTMDNTSAYKDGTYDASGVYRSPAGSEEIQVSLTLKKDVVTAAHATAMASNPKSKMMQEAFVAGFGAQVVGKPIDGLSLGVVNGSSLTPKGFMDAVVKIKAEAKGA